MWYPSSEFFFSTNSDITITIPFVQSIAKDQLQDSDRVSTTDLLAGRSSLCKFFLLFIKLKINEHWMNSLESNQQKGAVDSRFE